MTHASLLQVSAILAADALRESLKKQTEELKEARKELSKKALFAVVEMDAYSKPLPGIGSDAMHFAPARVVAIEAMASCNPVAQRPAAQRGEIAMLQELHATLPELWSARGKSVDAWVCVLAESLLRHARQRLLVKSRLLASRKPALARLCLLPALLDLLENPHDDGKFAATLAQAASVGCDDALRTEGAPPPQEKQATELQLQLLLQIRAHSTPLRASDGWRFPKLWNAVDWQRAAHAAHAAGAPLTALQLLEASCEQSSELQPEMVLQRAAGANLLLDILSQLPTPDATLGMSSVAIEGLPGVGQQQLLQEDGLGSLDRLSLLDTLHQVQLANRGLPGTSQQDDEALVLKMAVTLRNMGCDHLSASCLAQAAHESAAVREARAEAAWRLGQWDQGDVMPTSGAARGAAPAEPGFHERLFGAVVWLQQGRPVEAHDAMEECAQGLVASLGQLGDEGGKRLDELCVALRQCMQICQVASAGSEGTAAAAAAATGAQLHAATAGAGRVTSQEEYRMLEPVLALRASLLRMWADPTSASGSLPLAAALLHSATLAREVGRLPMAAARLTELAALPLSDATRRLCEWEQTQLLWHAAPRGEARGELAGRPRAVDAAAALLREVGASRADGSNARLEPADATLEQRVCTTLAAWRAAEGSSSARAERAIVDLHERAAASCEGLLGDAGDARGAAHHAHATYLEALYRGCEAAKSSQRERQLQELHLAAREELASLSALPEGLDDGAARQRAAELTECVGEHERRAEARDARLEELARRSFVQHAESARHSDEHNHAATFAMLTLWFAHPRTLPDAGERLCALPTRKLLSLVPQLACRLGRQAAAGGSADGDDSARQLQKGLRRVLLHVGAAHIRAVLPHILALALGDHYAPGERAVVADQSQLKASREVVQELRQGLVASGKSDVVDATQRLFFLYLQIAWVDVQTTKGLLSGTKTPPLDKLVGVDLKLKSNADLKPGRLLYEALQLKGSPSRAPVLTRPADAWHEDDEAMVTVDGFSAPSRTGGGRRATATFACAGGVNLPKIVQCYGSDGRVYTQLVKGRDDGRQDAALQEVFSLVNTLLHQDPQTRQRSLKLRTYRIVPLAPTAALLQWVDNSMPLMTYLCGSRGAHERYRPRDLKFAEARRLMEAAYAREKERKAGKSRLEVYEEVAERLRPVMHHFFLERWTQPSAWFERRLAYARSLAASSMAGFIVGLGDRHSSNILVDKETAELVHIDLGIAFDQGTLLKTPECVPFRLTRDLVDALGVCGVEGPMRGAAEQTMRVLRSNGEALLAILQLIVHNPMHRWAQDEERMQGAQRERAGPAEPLSRNQEAERALARVQLKLEGREKGRQERLGVEGQVRQLIDQARDPANLSQMFEGWAPWL